MRRYAHRGTNTHQTLAVCRRACLPCLLMRCAGTYSTSRAVAAYHDYDARVFIIVAAMMLSLYALFAASIRAFLPPCRIVSRMMLLDFRARFAA